MKQIILASASERRTKILEECGIDHKVVVSKVEEVDGSNTSVLEAVRQNARIKAEDVASSEKDSIIIGADTLVVHGSDIIGKPADETAARQLLDKFSGDVVDVYTGLCVIDTSNGRKAIGLAKSEVTVLPLNEEDGDKFFKLMAPYDKAGGFTIEGIGSFLFDEIRGSYFNVLGLPMIRLRELFADIGEEILDYVKK